MNRPRRADASMTLLTQVVSQPVDPGYAAAAQRRAQQGLTADRGTRGRSVVAVVGVMVIGVLLGTAWWQAHRSAPTGTATRTQLVDQIRRQDAEAGRLQRRNAALVRRIESQQARLLQLAARGELAAELTTLSLATGAQEVVGPGLVVTVDDAVAADDSDAADGQDSQDGQVLDQDLQVVVNGLWFAGAEAVAINGQRLTALSAIRSAGEAILVDYRPLVTPYRIEAIGDPARLRPRFNDGPGGRDVQYLVDNFGVRVSIESVPSFRLPASAGLTTRRARVLVEQVDERQSGTSPGPARSAPASGGRS
ncbi:MAG: DUF881 domain-containing protein [Angustibacter sp.]